MSPPKTPQFAPFDDASLQAFCDLLGARTGLQVRDKDRASAARTLAGRAQVLRISAAVYLQKLRIEKVDGAEWTHLMPLLTNGESYFERDKGQFALIRDTILPDLIQRRGRDGEKTLRLWSAGCSTGEEVYSLAMVTHAALPRGWKVTILGTDINMEALQRARRAVYGAWSFRGVEPTTRDRYFCEVGGGYEVVPELRERVTFAFCNLSASDWPDAERGITDMDLIVCRNVLIYFQRTIVAQVLSRFTRTLRAGGYLLTGHAELHDQNVAPLRTRLFPTSTAYQKEGGEPKGLTPPRPLASSNTATHSPRDSASNFTPMGTGLLSTRERTGEAGRLHPHLPSRTVPPAPIPKNETKTADEWCANAQRHADGGRYEEAIECCRNALALNASHPDAYLVWAHIAEERGQMTQAKELLKKVIYLAPSRAEAYVALGAVYEREGDGARARQMRVSAQKVLQLLTGSGATSPLITELTRHVEQLLDEGGTSTSTGTRR